MLLASFAPFAKPAPERASGRRDAASREEIVRQRFVGNDIATPADETGPGAVPLNHALRRKLPLVAARPRQHIVESSVTMAHHDEMVECFHDDTASVSF